MFYYAQFVAIFDFVIDDDILASTKPYAPYQIINKAIYYEINL